MMLWWLIEIMDQEALQTFTREQRSAALRAWAVAIVAFICIMAPLEYFLIFDLGVSDVLSGGISAAISVALGIALSALVSPKIWPILRNPRVPHSN